MSDIQAATDKAANPSWLNGLRGKVGGLIGGLGAPVAATPAPVPVAAPPQTLASGAPPYAGPSSPATPQPWRGPTSAAGGLGEGFSFGGAAQHPIMNANPAIPVGGMSPEAAEVVKQGPSNVHPGMAPAQDLSRAVGTAEQWSSFGGKVRDAAARTANVVGKVAKPLGIVAGANDVYQGLRDGDTARAGWGGADLAATGLLATPAAPAAGAYLAGRGLYAGSKLAADAINNHLSDGAKDAIGSAVNTGVRGLGNMLGQDWGVDDSAYKTQQAQNAVPVAGARPAQSAAMPADRMGVPKGDQNLFDIVAQHQKDLPNLRARSAAIHAWADSEAAARAAETGGQKAANTAAVEQSNAGLGLPVAQQRGAVKAGPDGQGLRAALDQGKTMRLSEGVFTYNGEDGVRNITGSGVGAGVGDGPGQLNARGTLNPKADGSSSYGDPNSESNRALRGGFMVDLNGNKIGNVSENEGRARAQQRYDDDWAKRNDYDWGASGSGSGGTWRDRQSASNERIAREANMTSRLNNQETNQTADRSSLRSTDASVYGHQLGVQQAMALHAMTREQNNVQNGFRAQELGQKETTDAQAQRGRTQEQAEKHIKALVDPNDPNSLATTTAQYNSGLSDITSGLRSQLGAETDPGKLRAIKNRLLDINKNGVEADPELYNKLTRGIRAAQFAEHNSTASYNPIGETSNGGSRIPVSLRAVNKDDWHPSYVGVGADGKPTGHRYTYRDVHGLGTGHGNADLKNMIER